MKYQRTNDKDLDDISRDMPIDVLSYILFGKTIEKGSAEWEILERSEGRPRTLVIWSTLDGEESLGTSEVLRTRSQSGNPSEGG